MATLCEQCAPWHESLRLKEQELLTKEQHLTHWTQQLAPKVQHLRGWEEHCARREQQLNELEKQLKSKEQQLREWENKLIDSAKELQDQTKGVKKVKITHESGESKHAIETLPWNVIASVFGPKDVMQLSQLTRTMHSKLKPFIETNFEFRIPLAPAHMQTLSPKKVEIFETTINFGYNQSITHLTTCLKTAKYPPKITHLTCHDVNYPIADLPITLSHFTLGDNFSNDVVSLPIALTHFTTGDCFDQPVEFLPCRLTHLIVGERFDQPVNQLPQSLVHFEVKGAITMFNQSLDHLPPNLTHLLTGTAFNKPINKLPSTLTHLKLGCDFNQSVDNLPHSLIYLEFSDFNQPINNLPPKLTHLYLGFSFNQHINNIPHSITHLTIGSSFNQPIAHLPPKLIYLKLGDSFNQPVLEKIPKTLKRLVIGRNFSQDTSSASFEVFVVCQVRRTNRIFECGKRLFNEFGLKYGDMLLLPKRDQVDDEYITTGIQGKVVRVLRSHPRPTSVKVIGLSNGLWLEPIKGAVLYDEIKCRDDLKRLGFTLKTKE